MTSTLRFRASLLPAGLCIALALLASPRAMADPNDPPSRVARLGFLDGSISFQPAGTDDWVAPPVNRPLTTGDQLWSDQNGRAELQLDGSTVRLGPNTSLSLLNLGDNVTQLQLSGGSVLVHVRRLDDSETYEVDTPNLAFSVLRPGLYRITVDPSGATTAVQIRRGQAEVTGGGLIYSVGENEYDVFSGTDQLVEDAQEPPPNPDAFDAWSDGRDSRWEHSASAQYVSEDVVGYEDLDDQGSWAPTPGYGAVWYPRQVEAGWAPYHDGHWAYIAPWGYTWVDDAPWGYAPFHYGRWVSVSGRWGWVPAPPAPPGAVYVRPVYAPALVAWVGVSAAVAWFALGPREVFVPSYPVSRSYVNSINVSNTNVNTTVVTNVYNTTVINKTTVNNITYVNRTVPGAVVATTPQAFASAQSVSKNVVRVDAHAVATAQVRSLAPATVPTKQSVLGSGRSMSAKPPAAVQARAIVARTTPPPPPPTFERRAEAIKNNGGKPLSVAQVRLIQPAPTARPAAVKIAPPARIAPKVARQPAPAARPAEPRPPIQRPVEPTLRPAERPPTPAATERPAIRPPATAVHPNDIPAPPRPASPSTAETVLERQHLQEQQQLHAKQEAERQQVQKQQELEHARQAKQQADAAQKEEAQRQLERQHEEQTQALAQKHEQEQKAMQAKQEAQKRQQEKEPPPPPKR